jgi:tetratricopeptide (TPR) repeat protein
LSSLSAAHEERQVADKIKPSVTTPSASADEAAQLKELTEAFEKGTLEVVRSEFDISKTLTRENLEKFFSGKLTWAQLMGMTMEEAYNLAEIGYGLYEEGRFHDARIVFEALVVSNPYDAYFHNILGAIYQQLDMREEALEQYSIAIDLDPEQMHSLVNRGEILLQDGQFERALEDLKRAMALDKSGNDPVLVRARALVTAATTIVEGVQKLFGKDQKAKPRAR